MDSAFTRMLRFCVPAVLFMPLVCIACSQLSQGLGLTRGFLSAVVIAAVAPAVLLLLLSRLLRRHGEAIDAAARDQARFLDELPDRLIVPAIVFSAALSLFFELTTIRWQGTVFKFFDIYKNIGLLACFLGLGLGYALARRPSIPLAFVIPLFCLQAGLLLLLKHGLSWRAEVFLANPVREQLQMGLPLAEGLAQYVAIYAFMTVVFLLSALTFVPVGQLCGRVMQRRGSVHAYGCNLLGSVLGVLLAFGVAALWTPPAIWFAIAFAGLIVFHARGRPVVLGSVCSLAGIALLAIPVPSGWEKIYSPYQLIERGPSKAEGMDGLSTLTVAGKYYQRILDLSVERQSWSESARRMANQYDLPYFVHEGKVGRVAVLGSGTGNDVAAALRAGAEQVDAIEIDPAILEMGRMYHPERPYSDPRVNGVVDDARTFLRNTNERYDMIVYGLLDAQTLLSHGSSVRLDSFVYTVEGLREARARLAPGGLLALSFAIVSQGQGCKIHRMIAEAFDGQPPESIETDIGDVVYLRGAEGNPAIPPELLEATGFVDVTARYADPSIAADVSTDDWPFLYMQTRVYPTSYVAMLVVLPLLALLFIRAFFRFGRRALGGADAGGFGHPAFFFLGAGFMLIETKGITELGLTFGNTWHVVGVVILGVLIMAWLANLLVETVGVRRVVLPYLLLLASIGAGLAVAKAGGLPSTLLGRLGTVAVLTGPLFFSGLVFSTTLARTGNVSAAMASNLLGAMCGGLLEYNSMYFGFRFLYWIAMALYVLAWVSSWKGLRPEASGLKPHASQ